jgi:CIC family chloride channel protein
MSTELPLNYGSWHAKMIAWREKHIKERHFILILAVLVGIFTAIAAFLLKGMIHLIQYALTGWLNVDSVNYWYLLYPAVGILIASLFVRYIVRDDISHGVTKILYAISRRQGRIKRHNTWTSMVASAVTIGFGGSVGAEAPIVLTGSAIGSNLGNFFRMNHNILMLMLGCGSAGAISAIFNAPIAGVVFVLEVLMLDFSLASIVPLLTTAITAASFSYLFNGGNFAMFDFDISVPFRLANIPYIVLLGIACGLVSLYYTRMMNRLEGIFRKQQSPFVKLLIGGAMLSVLIFLFPSLYGEGYHTIQTLLGTSPESVLDGSLFYGLGNEMWVLVLFLVLTVAFKVFATSATNGAGGTGGVFAPSLFAGCITGFLIATGLNMTGLIDHHISEQNFALAGMAGVMSGVMHAPLTAIFLIAELTGGYGLFMNLTITAVVSYITIKTFEPYSIYAMRLAKRGELLTHHKDRAVLTLLSINSLIEKDFQMVKPEMKLGDLVKLISLSKRNIFPVINKEGKIQGIVLLDDIRNIMFRPELYERFSLQQLMTSPPAYVNINDSPEKIMKLFESTKAWNLPVVDNNKRYMGFVSKSKVLSSYREVLATMSEE